MNGDSSVDFKLVDNKMYQKHIHGAKKQDLYNNWFKGKTKAEIFKLFENILNKIPDITPEDKEVILKDLIKALLPSEIKNKESLQEFRDIRGTYTQEQIEALKEEEAARRKAILGEGGR